MDTRQGTHMESFLLTRSVSGLLMNGCSKSEERGHVVGGEGGAQGVSAQVWGRREAMWGSKAGDGGAGASHPSRTQDPACGS